MELRAAIFAILDDLRWPSAKSDDTERELLQAIREAPNDNGPRLVYADWLTERGDRRGEFIMLHCHHDLDVRQRALPLLYTHPATWMASLPRWVHQPTWDRGFVSRVRCTIDKLRAFRHELAAVTPVPEVELYEGGRGQLEALV